MSIKNTRIIAGRLQSAQMRKVMGNYVVSAINKIQIYQSRKALLSIINYHYFFSKT